jgi:predicted N-formylglutamate amidohydrolase
VTRALESARAFVIITCEHGGNRVPARYAPLFRDFRHALESHRGYDPGALVMARHLAHAFAAPLIASTVSRLVVELNRSPWNRKLWSQMTGPLPQAERERILARYYVPYRHDVESRVARAVKSGRRVVHVSSHSFTPVLDGKVREADVGILYDPARRGEVKLAANWKAAFARCAPALRVRRNYPYEGKADGLTAYLRHRYAARDYVGVELELNQAIVAAPPLSWRALRESVTIALRAALTRA